MGDVQPGCRGAAHELVGVLLGPTGVGVVEVAPGEHVHPAYARVDHLRGEGR